MLTKSTELKRTYLMLFAACMLGTWALFPYALSMNMIPNVNSKLAVLSVFTGEAAVLYGVALLLSYLMVPKTDLKPFETHDFVKRVVFPGAGSGILVGILLFGLNSSVFHQSVLANVSPPPAWIGALASLYGGINEEVLLRLFFFVLIYFGLGKIFKFKTSKRNKFLWIANGLSALGFGLMHLPAAKMLVPLTGFEVTRILFLNGIPGMVFGWLFWTRGFYAAAIAHFFTDITIHVMFPS